MIIWIILMGGLASQGTTHQEWFVKTLANSCSYARIFGTLELSLFLSSFLWSDFYLGPVFEEFWSAIAAAQTMNNDEGDDGD
jgi:hypothetical protein